MQRILNGHLTGYRNSISALAAGYNWHTMLRALTRPRTRATIFVGIPYFILGTTPIYQCLLDLCHVLDYTDPASSPTLDNHYVYTLSWLIQGIYAMYAG
jgi:hypothetical protein